MKNISTGFGLCVLGLGVALFPILDRLAPNSKEAHAGVPVAAITAAVIGQAAPTIVWYGTAASEYKDGPSNAYLVTQVTRAWSDGRLEARFVQKRVFNYNAQAPDCSSAAHCITPWILISDPAQGYAAMSDADGNTQVDGADLALLLGNWGDAPRHDIPPSDCPLNLINP